MPTPFDHSARPDEPYVRFVSTPSGLAADESCPKCGADLDDGECEECERAAPLDFDT